VRSRCQPPRSSLALVAALALPSLAPVGPMAQSEPPRVVVFSSVARDSMNAVFRRFNEHWDELGDLNTLERMLGTVRPTQLEYLGCLQGSVAHDTVWIDSWQPAANLKQLQLAVAGNCDSVSHLVGTWHSHPYRANLENLPVKERTLSAQDLKTFGESGFPVTVVIWDVDSVDGASKDGNGRVLHPVQILFTSAHLQKRPPQQHEGNREVDDQTGHIHQRRDEGGGRAGRIEADSAEEEGQHRSRQ
jgi:hypothetical protein